MMGVGVAGVIGSRVAAVFTGPETGFIGTTASTVPLMGGICSTAKGLTAASTCSGQTNFARAAVVQRALNSQAPIKGVTRTDLKAARQTLWNREEQAHAEELREVIHGDEPDRGEENREQDGDPAYQHRDCLL